MDDLDSVSHRLRDFYRASQPIDDVLPRSRRPQRSSRLGHGWRHQLLAAAAILALVAGLMFAFRALGISQSSTVRTQHSAVPASSVAPVSRLAPRIGASMAFDKATQALVVFGGESANASNRALAETWSLTRQGWQQERTAHAPSPRSSSALAYDAGNQVLTLFGGEGFPSAGSGVKQAAASRGDWHRDPSHLRPVKREGLDVRRTEGRWADAGAHLRQRNLDMGW